MKRVLLVESGRFIGGVISSLFQAHQQIELIEARPANGCELLKAVREAQPAIVIMDDTLNDEYLEQLLSYMQQAGDLRVVVVSTSSNQVEVYQKEQVPVLRAADFFAVL